MAIIHNFDPTVSKEADLSTIAFEDGINRGVAVANELADFTTLIPRKSRHFKDIQAVIGNRLGETGVAVDTATALICLGEVAIADRLEAESRNAFIPVGQVDFRMLTACNHALRGLVHNAAGSNYQSYQLHETLMAFAHNHGYIRSEDNPVRLEINVYNRLLSAWCEQNIINLFRAAATPIKIADIDEDTYGRDALIAIGDNIPARVSLDFKSFFGTLKADAEESNLSVQQIHSVSSRGVDKDGGIDRCGNPLDPVWFLLRKDRQQQIHYALTLDIGRTHWDNMPPRLAPDEQIGQGNGVASVKELLEYVSSDVKHYPYGYHRPPGVTGRLGQITVRTATR